MGTFLVAFIVFAVILLWFTGPEKGGWYED